MSKQLDTLAKAHKAMSPYMATSQAIAGNVDNAYWANAEARVMEERAIYGYRAG